jgi:hypothetical protein
MNDSPLTLMLSVCAFVWPALLLAMLAVALDVLSSQAEDGDAEDRATGSSRQRRARSADHDAFALHPGVDRDFS